MSDSLEIREPSKYERMASHIVRATRDQVLTTKTNFTTIAESLGLVRQTVSKRLDSDDLPLSMFLAAQLESGGDPAAVIAQATGSQALAGKEAE
ncbi:hypothetical protein EMO92_06935 [Bifidobacterium reuteri]|uniref:Uncharacterized protein n=1 Tax=Bifidobacterium reuteri TaxID=983706 RepID=A0A5J5E7M2_9BIFI|nr:MULTISPECIES: hypothetical protein [Bifidobacterium]KAA8825148.1 hypothetical protein EMO92_06935 [Bifidobacterium reuteri]TPF78390.1 hypothetical protein BW09_04880 [Bifidobacterium sp. UTCIF-1]TPF81190.1 hypothetical protein BW08_00700 [Bifidobacterium sp. UTCIF-24]TPF81970.1 hypothetical protein BW12_06865 [Bifidobacterium sp. UTCIF-3]TPF85182.1 hypothetical protein BW07_00485 [Bifidobacterium sp. UTCIF-36]